MAGRAEIARVKLQNSPLRRCGVGLASASERKTVGHREKSSRAGAHLDVGVRGAFLRVVEKDHRRATRSRGEGAGFRGLVE